MPVIGFVLEIREICGMTYSSDKAGNLARSDVHHVGNMNIQHRTLTNQTMKTNYDLEERLLEYSARIIRLVDRLPGARAANHVGSQLLRSGTSPLPNHGE